MGITSVVSVTKLELEMELITSEGSVMCKATEESAASVYGHTDTLPDSKHSDTVV